MKTLICLIGDLRASEKTLDRFCNLMVEPNNADILISAPFWENNPFYEIAKYKYIGKNPKPLINEYNKICQTLNGNKDWFETIRRKPGTWAGGLTRIGSGAYIYYYKYLALKLIHTLKIYDNYDFFVFTRSDHFYTSKCKINELVDTVNDIWIPVGSDHNGICDRHWVISHDSLDKVADMVTPMFFHPEIYSYRRKPWCSEQYVNVMMTLINRLKIKRTIRQQFIVRGSTSTRLWTKGVRIKEYDVIAAYYKEYLLSQ